MTLSDDVAMLDAERLLEAHRLLVGEGVIEPLSRDDDEVQRWLAWELASLAEGHFHQVLDVSALAADERLRWVRRATYRGRGLGDPHRSYTKPYWLLSAGRRVGTLAIEALPLGRRDIGIASLYVQPDLRRQGIAARALEATYDTVVQAGADGLRVPTSWCWQNAVRFYVRLGLWVQNWKHSLVFTRRKDLGPYRVRLDGDTASFLVLRDGGWTAWLQAENRGTVLGWTELPGYTAGHALRSAARRQAPGTFALSLALEGWPLVRSAELWQQRHDSSDMGMPEGLAYKIAAFEAVDREQGYDLRCPRIPGLDYRVASEG